MPTDRQLTGRRLGPLFTLEDRNLPNNLLATTNAAWLDGHEPFARLEDIAVARSDFKPDPPEGFHATVGRDSDLARLAAEAGTADVRGAAEQPKSSSPQTHMADTAPAGTIPGVDDVRHLPVVPHLDQTRDNGGAGGSVPNWSELGSPKSTHEAEPVGPVKGNPTAATSPLTAAHTRAA